jgi:hypothetical protein
MKFELEFDWDHGPDITLVIYAKRTHILTIAWSSYPVLGGAKPLDLTIDEITNPVTIKNSQWFGPWFGIRGGPNH